MSTRPFVPVVLLVDDELQMRALIPRLLKPHGVEVVTRADGRSALSDIPTLRPDLVILDWVLPDLQGIEVLARMKASPATARIPVIMITGVLDPELEEHAMKLGAIDFVTKPWSSGELEARVRLALGL